MNTLVKYTTLIAITLPIKLMADDQIKESLIDLRLRGLDISQAAIIHNANRNTLNTVRVKPGSTHIFKGHDKSRQSNIRAVNNSLSRNSSEGVALHVKGRNARIIFDNYTMTNRHNVILTSPSKNGLAAGTNATIDCLNCSVAGMILQNNFGNVINR